MIGQEIIILLLLLIASYYDIKKRAVPNILSLSAVVFGIVVNLISYNFNAIIVSTIMFIALSFLHGLKRIYIGGADIKFMVAICLFLPHLANLIFILAMCLMLVVYVCKDIKEFAVIKFLFLGTAMALIFFGWIR